MNGSWHPDMLQRRHTEFEKSFDLVENEKYAILGMRNSVYPIISLLILVENEKYAILGMRNLVYPIISQLRYLGIYNWFPDDNLSKH